MTQHRLYTGTFDDGSQIYVESWDDTGNVYAATRPSADTRVTWGPPILLTLEETD